MYKRKIGVSIIQKDNQFYIIDGSQIYKGNELSARILALCNGKNSENEIIEKLAQKFPVSKQVLETDVNNFLNELIEANLIIHTS